MDTLIFGVKRSNIIVSLFYRRVPEIQHTTDLAPLDLGKKPKLDQVGRMKSKCRMALMKDLFFNR